MAGAAPSDLRSASNDCSSCPQYFGSLNHPTMQTSTQFMGPELRCLIPWFVGAIPSKEWKDTFWNQFVTGVPRTGDRQSFAWQMARGDPHRQGCITAIHCPAEYCAAMSREGQASLSQLSRELGINPKTVAKWRKRATVEDMKTRPKEPCSTVQTEAEGAMIVAFRRQPPTHWRASKGARTCEIRACFVRDFRHFRRIRRERSRDFSQSSAQGPVNKSYFSGVFGDPGRIRTCNLPLRRGLLYPVEPRGHAPPFWPFPAPMASTPAQILRTVREAWTIPRFLTIKGVNAIIRNAPRCPFVPSIPANRN